MKLFEQIATESIFNIGEAKSYRHRSNGLQVVLLPNRVAPVVTIQVWYHVGSKNEQLGKTGIAHLFEHMMFRGTKKYPVGQYDRLLDEVGGQHVNAFTGVDYTAYMASVPSQSIELPIQLEADRMVHLNINQELLDIEREAVLNERRLRVDNSPDGSSWEMLMRDAYKQHPYQNDVIGHEVDIKGITLDDCYDFYNQYYAPDNATIVITGDFNPEETLEMLQTHFGYIPSGKGTRTPIPKAIPVTAIQQQKGFDISTPRLLMGYRMCRYNHPDFLPLKLFTLIFSQIHSSILKQEFIFNNQVISIFAEPMMMEDPGIFVIESILKQGDDPDRMMIRIEETVIQLMTTLTSKHLDVAKTRYRMDLYSAYTSNLYTGYSFGESIMLTDDPFYEYRSLKKIETITVEDVKQVILTYLKPKNRISIVLTPDQ